MEVPLLSAVKSTYGVESTGKISMKYLPGDNWKLGDTFVPVPCTLTLVEISGALSSSQLITETSIG